MNNVDLVWDGLFSIAIYRHSKSVYYDEHWVNPYVGSRIDEIFFSNISEVFSRISCSSGVPADGITRLRDFPK